MSLWYVPTPDEYAMLEQILDSRPVTRENIDQYVPRRLHGAAHLMLAARERKKSARRLSDSGKT